MRRCLGTQGKFIFAEGAAIFLVVPVEHAESPVKMIGEEKKERIL